MFDIVILIINFINFAVPIAPTDVTSRRLNGTHMLVRWSQPSLIESRGFITSYIITYTSLRDLRRQATGIIVPGDSTQAIIGDLLPNSVYTVSVGASTSAGTGELSTPAVTPRKP